MAHKELRLTFSDATAVCKQKQKVGFNDPLVFS